MRGRVGRGPLSGAGAAPGRGVLVWAEPGRGADRGGKYRRGAGTGAGHSRRHPRPRRRKEPQRSLAT